MDKQRFQDEAKCFNRHKNADINEKFTSNKSKRVVKCATKRAAKYTIKFDSEKAKFKFNDSKSGSSLKFEDDSNFHGNDVLSVPKLNFEDDKGFEYQNHLPHAGHETGKKLNGKNKRKLASGVASGGIDYIADSSENEGLQGANIERKILFYGAKKGFKTGSRWYKSHETGATRRDWKAKNKELLRESKENLYRLRHGKPSLRESVRKKQELLKKQAKAAAEKKFGERTAKEIEKIVAYIAEKAVAIIRAAVAYVFSPLLGILLILFAIGLIAFLLVGSINITTITVISAYTAEPDAIEQSSCYYTKLEAELDKKIKDIPSSWEWAYIDEFRYDLDPIGHDAFQIMAYLNVKYPGFNLEDELLWQQVKTELDYIFDLRYELILDEEIEIRSYEESSTDEFGNETTTTYYYPYYILNVILHAKEQEPILLSELNRNPEEELTEWYGVLQETQGARQEYANPFGGYDWRVSVSSLYGWRIDPIGGRELQMHHGLDIAMPRGTPIFAGIDGVVRYTGFDSIMGSYIILDADDGRTIKYGHCDSINVSMGEKVKAGETIVGRVGSSGQSTGAHLHVEIMENGEYLDPIYSLGFLPPE